MSKEKELRCCLDRLGYIKYEMCRLNCTLLAAQSGIPFGEAVAEEVFIEDRRMRNHSWSVLAVMIEHLLLLKMKYYTKDRPQSIPEHCPWSLRNLINDTIDELLELFPD